MLRNLMGACIVLAIVGMSGLARGAFIEATASGTIDTVIGFSAEPFVGFGDSYDLSISFEIDANDTISKLSGSASINESLTSFFGFGGVISGGPGSRELSFSLVPFGQGPSVGNFNIEEVHVRFFSPSLDFFPSAFALLTADDATISRSNIFGVRNNGGGSFGFSNNIDNDPESTISVIPVPPALLLMGTGLAMLGIVLRRTHRAA